MENGSITLTKRENEPSRSAKKEKDKESEPLLTVADAASRASTRAAQLLHRAEKSGKRKHHCYNAEYEPSRPAKKEKNMVMEPLSTVADADSRAPTKAAPLPHRAAKRGKRKHHFYQAEYEPSRSAKKEKDKELESLLTVADAASRASTRAAPLLHRTEESGKRKHHSYNAEYEPSRSAREVKDMELETLSTMADADSRASSLQREGYGNRTTLDGG